MKNDGLLTGIFIGGMFGVAVALLAVNTAKGAASNTATESNGDGDGEELNSGNQNEDKQTVDNAAETTRDSDTVPMKQAESKVNSAAKKKTDNKDNNENASNAETGKEKDNQVVKTNSTEVVNKKDDLEKEVRNPEEERKKKTGKEGAAMGENIASKINFGKKIAQLEESLKKLREENTQEN